MHHACHVLLRRAIHCVARIRKLRNNRRCVSLRNVYIAAPSHTIDPYMSTATDTMQGVLSNVYYNDGDILHIAAVWHCACD